MMSGRSSRRRSRLLILALVAGAVGALAVSAVALAGSKQSSPPVHEAHEVPAARLAGPRQGPDRPVTGTVRLAGGASIIGGAVGQVLPIEAAFEAASPHGEVDAVRTRISLYCPPPGEDLADSPWRAFSPREMFPYLVWAGGISPYALAAQYRDAGGRLSPVVCDSVNLEGLVTPGPPVTPTPTPTPRVADYQQFRIDAPWQPPTALYNASDVGVGPDGTVYVLDAWNQRVLAFGPDGSFRDEWGGLGLGDGHFATPNGLAIGPNGGVYVADHASEVVDREYPDRLQRFSATGRFLGACPGGIRADAVGLDGSLYGAWYPDAGEIRRYSPDCRFLDSWGEKGSGPGQFGSWVDVAVAPDGRLYVADGGNRRIQVFSADGRFLGQWGSGGREDGAFDGSLRLAIGRNGDVVVTELAEAWGRVQRFTADGRYLGRIGPVVDHWSQLANDVAVGPDGSVYLLRVLASRIERYAADGTALEQWGHSIDRIPQREIVGAALGTTGELVVFDLNQVQGYGSLGGRRWVRDLPADGGTIVAGDVSADGVVTVLKGDRVLRLGADGQPMGEWLLVPLDGLQDLAAGPGGMTHVADGARHRVLALDAGGRVVAEWGAEGACDGCFPERIALDVSPEGLVYVLDLPSPAEGPAESGAPSSGWPAQAAEQRVQVFDAFGHRRGAFVVQDFLAGNLPEYSRARDIAVGPNGAVYLAVVGSEPADPELGWLVAITGALTPPGEGGIGLSFYLPDDCAPGGFKPIAVEAGTDGRLAVVEMPSFNLPRRVTVFGPRPLAGWRAVFHRDRTRGDWPEVTAVDAVRFDWGEGGPLPGLPGDGFVARFEGRVQGDATEPLARYRLAVTADGGVRLWLDQRLVLDTWDAVATDAAVNVDLLTDQAVPVVLETTDPAGRAAVRLDWSRVFTVRGRLYLPWTVAVQAAGP